MVIRNGKFFAKILGALVVISPLTLNAMEKQERARAEAQAKAQMMRSIELKASKDLFKLQWLEGYNGDPLPELSNHVLLILLNDRIHDEINSVVDILTLNYPKAPKLVKKIEALHKAYGHEPSVIIVSKALQEANKSLLDIKGSLSKSTALHIAAFDKLEASVKILLSVARLFGQAKLLIDALDTEYRKASHYADKKIAQLITID